MTNFMRTHAWNYSTHAFDTNPRAIDTHFVTDEKY